MYTSRTYLSSSGVTWRVMQWIVGRSPALPPAPALIFTSAGGGTTELREFPSDWMHLSDGELEGLRASAGNEMRAAG